jgi:AcrR family transcriptional regulator
MARKLDIVRRAELAAKAVQVLRARGVAGTTMSHLAGALGIKRPTLYFYFRDLGGVFDVVFEDTQRRYLEHVAQRMIGVEHPIEQLSALARATAEFHHGQRDLVVLLFQLWAVGGTDPERVVARGRELFEPTRQMLIARLAAGLAAGTVAPCDPARVVDLVQATLDGAMVAQVSRRASPGPIVEEMIARVLEPLVLRPRARASRAPARPPARSLR